ncbi:hypothetical protein CYMTET_10479 [Cymbomonas tetramitiformis]|uniref:HEPN domain-containing protein n=1 Tax=Cymbomonas tetramitiformis TaxID=36881 RepID=A0AAE0GPI1_9CHLO|nr:hypothetical protein CYMTET_10479 [Cymbomonas tetramitiformis]
MSGFSLEVDPVGALRNILSDYPGGQMLQEGLQNADDAKASRFALLLDLRRHPTRGLRHPGLERAQSEALVLFDDGGFKERDWRSLRRMYRSEKENSPTDTGRYGMGSRSYFHYTDLLTVVSGTKYVTMDPLEICFEEGSQGEEFVGGAFRDANKSECAPLLLPLFGCDLASPLAGTVIRLPLRREEHAASGIASHAFTPEQAEALMAQFAGQLAHGHPLLFLPHVATVELWRWGRDATAPERILHATASGVGPALPRIPSALPKSALGSFELLQAHLAALTPASAAALVEESLQSREITIRVDRPGLAAATARWLVTVQLSMDPKLLARLVSVKALPSVGVALPFQLASDAAPSPAGGVSCYLPMPLQTGLPVHLQGGFQVTKNRRNLWRLAPTPLDGIHREWAEWNEVLLAGPLPRLYAAVLAGLGGPPSSSSTASPPRPHGALSEDILTAGRRQHAEAKAPPPSDDHRFPRLPPAARFALWPDTSRVLADWRVLLRPLHEALRSLPVLPHAGDAGGVCVAPAQAVAVRLPTAALREQRGALLEAYAEERARRVAAGDDAADRLPAVVDVPEHVCTALEGDGVLAVQSPEWLFQEWLLSAAQQGQIQASRLAPAFLALAEHLGRNGCPPEELARWRERLCGCKLLRLPGGALVEVADAFVPGTPELTQFPLVAARTPALHLAGCEDSEALGRCLEAWGLKRRLTWQDALAEAKDVERQAKEEEEEGGTGGKRSSGRGGGNSLERGRRLLEYIEQRGTEMPAAGRDEALAELREVLFVPVLLPSLVPPDTASPAPRAGRLASALRKEHRGCTWAVASTVVFPCRLEGLGFKALELMGLSPELLAQQCAALARLARDDDIDVAWVVPHILEALRELQAEATRRAWSDEDIRGLLRNLREVAWVPCALEGSNRILLPPIHVALESSHQLLPVFGKLAEDCRRHHEHLFQLAGVESRHDAGALVAELRRLADGGERLTTGRTRPRPLAVRLCLELDEVLAREGADGVTAKVYVPTARGRMAPARSVFVNDAPWRGAGRGEVETLHESIPISTGLRLGCSSHEDLADRLRELLRECEAEDLFPEFFQNCDDHGAQVVRFALDCRHYSHTAVPGRHGAAVQGPALLIGSTRALDAADLLRIQRIGRSAKRTEFGSGGRFGVGLNSMYHYSDCPQLLANDGLHFFDPLRKFFARRGADEPPGRAFAVTALGAHFPHAMLPFAAFIEDLRGDLRSGEREPKFPTVFRLPLRAETSPLGDAMTVPKALAALERFARGADHLLVFSRAVCKVELAVCKEDGSRSLKQRVRCEDVSRTGGVPAARLPSTLEEVRGLTHSPRCWAMERAIKNEHQLKQRWLVAHTLSGAEGLPELAREFLEDPLSELALLPHAAVAVRLDSHRSSERGGVCCGTPIGVPTRLPLLLHGCFALPASRKHVPLPQAVGAGGVAGSAPLPPATTRAMRWNEALVRGPGAHSLWRLLELESLQEMVKDGDLPLTEYLQLLQVGHVHGASRAEHQLMGLLEDGTRRALLLSQVPFIPVVQWSVDCFDKRVMVVKKWHACRQGAPLAPFRPADTALTHAVQDVLVKERLHLAYLPEDMRQRFKETYFSLFPASTTSAVGHAGPWDGLDPRSLLTHLRSHPPEWLHRPHSLGSSENVQSLGRLAGLINKSFIQELLAFCIRQLPKGSFGTDGGHGLEALVGAPLLQLESGQVLVFGQRAEAPLLVDFHELLPFWGEGFMAKWACEKLSCLAGFETSLENLGLARMQPADLARHLDAVRRDRLYERADWESRFWRLLQERGWKPSEGDALSDWPVLPVYSLGERKTPVERRPLGLLRAAFSTHLVEPDWELDVRGALLAAGVPVLHQEVIAASGKTCSAVTRLHALCTDAQLAEAVAEAGAAPGFAEAHRQTLLQYFASRRLWGQAGEGLRQALKGAPLFRTMTGEFTSLDPCTEGVRFVAVKEGGGPPPPGCSARDLARLPVPGVVHLVAPSCAAASGHDECDSVEEGGPQGGLVGAEFYERLGVTLLPSAEYMTLFVIPHLAVAAEAAIGKSEAQVALEWEAGAAPYLALLMAFATAVETDAVSVAAAASVVAAGAECKFVPTDDGCGGFTLRPPNRLLEPPPGLVAAFAQETALVNMHLPEAGLRVAHGPLLRALGMHRTLPPELLLNCAEHVHAEVERLSHLAAAASPPPLDLQLKAFWVVEAVCEALEEAWSTPPRRPLDALAGPMASVSRLRVLLARRGAASGGAESDLQLAPLVGAVLPRCAPVAFAASLVAAHAEVAAAGAAPLEGATALERLGSSHAEQLHQLLGVLAQPSQVPHEALVAQLRHLAAAAAGGKELGAAEELAEGSVAHSIAETLRECERRLKGEAAPQGELREALAGLRSLRCLPLPGVGDGAAALTLWAPHSVFWRLPDDSAQAYLMEADARGVVAECGETAAALGVRPSPSVSDWAACTARAAAAVSEDGFAVAKLAVARIIALLRVREEDPGEQVVQEEEGLREADSGDEGEEAMEDGDSDSGDEGEETMEAAGGARAALYLPDEDCRLLPVGSLVWADVVRQRERCRRGLTQLGMWLVHRDVLDRHPDSDAALLCSRFGLRQLSEIVRESVISASEPVGSATAAGGAVVRSSVGRAAAEAEEGVEAEAAAMQLLLRSSEFAEGSLTVLRWEQQQQASEARSSSSRRRGRGAPRGSEARVAEQLAGVCFLEQGETPPDNGGVGVGAAAGEAGWVMWLSSGALKRRPEAALTALSAQLNRLLRGCGTLGVLNEVHLMGMLRCWRGAGPAGVATALEEGGVRCVGGEEEGGGADAAEGALLDSEGKDVDPEDPPSEVRWADEALAVTYCKEAARVQAVAEKLHRLECYPDSVWYCQQAAEKRLKGCLMRTRGILNEEFRGRQAHSLVTLSAAVSTADVEITRCPSPMQERLAALADAYIKARYPQRPDEDPPSLYSEGASSDALELVTEVCAWAEAVELAVPSLPGDEMPAAEVQGLGQVAQAPPGDVPKRKAESALPADTRNAKAMEISSCLPPCPPPRPPPLHVEAMPSPPPLPCPPPHPPGPPHPQQPSRTLRLHFRPIRFLSTCSPFLMRPHPLHPASVTLRPLRVPSAPSASAPPHPLSHLSSYLPRRPSAAHLRTTGPRIRPPLRTPSLRTPLRLHFRPPHPLHLRPSASSPPPAFFPPPPSASPAPPKKRKRKRKSGSKNRINKKKRIEESDQQAAQDS